MIISHKKRFIFFHIPKTGGSSITWNLRNFVDSPTNIESLEIKAGWQSLLHIDGRQHSSYLDNVSLCEKYEGYFKFAFVRNPWDLALSWYLALSRDDPNSRDICPTNFKKFLVNRVQNYSPIISPIKFIKKYVHRGSRAISRTQFSYISDKNGRIIANYSGRFENYENELEYILERLGITEYESKRMNVANRTGIKYQDFYDLEGRQLIDRLFKADIEAFGYKFQEM